jgi:hypothetical protein
MSLHDEINNVVIKYLEEKLRTNESVDVVKIAEEMAASVVDMILMQEEQHQSGLLAETIRTLGDLFLKGRGLTQVLKMVQ